MHPTDRCMSCVSFAIICLLFLQNTVSEDPCTSSPLLEFLTQRVVGYNSTKANDRICDHILQDGWYSMGSYVLATKPSVCGTGISWYLKDPLPKGAGASKLTICRNDGTSCSESRTIQAMDCGGKYVFYLESLETCPEAYCVEPLGGANLGPAAPNIDTLHPRVTEKLEYVKNPPKGWDIGVLRFHCNFTPEQSMINTYFFKVEWMLTTRLSIVKSLHSSGDTQYNDETQFQQATQLKEETHLFNNRITEPGFQIMCSVIAKTELGGAYSTVRLSEPKYVGIKVILPEHQLRIQDQKSEDIQFQMTVPFGCPNKSASCEMILEVFYPKKSSGMDDCYIPELSTEPRDTKSCAITFNSNEVGKTVNFTITAIAGNQNTKLDITQEVIFRTIRYDSHALFSRYTLDPIQVALMTDTTKLNGKKCIAHSDPHMSSFDGQYFDNQNAGTFILYRNKKFNVEAQMTTTDCYPGSYAKCICGMAVRAGRDVFVINFCDRIPIIDFRACNDNILRGKVKQETNGNSYIVSKYS